MNDHTEPEVSEADYDSFWSSRAVEAAKARDWNSLAECMQRLEGTNAEAAVLAIACKACDVKLARLVLHRETPCFYCGTVILAGGVALLTEEGLPCCCKVCAGKYEIEKRGKA